MGSFDNMFLRIGNGILLQWLLLQFFIISLVLCQDYLNQPRDEWPEQDQQPQPKRKQRPIDPYKLYGPHGYRTFSHARCQEVPTVDVNLEEISGDWVLNEYITSVDGKPFPPHAPYLCPESLMKFSTAKNGRFNVSQVSFEWPLVHKDVVEWEVNPRKSGVFFHEENIFALWTFKVMEVVSEDHMLLFFCIDYTVWPGWNHRGVYILSRDKVLSTKIKRKLSPAAHRRMRMDYHRSVNTTVCEPEDYFEKSRERWHPHRKMLPQLGQQAPIHPYMSRKHRRNLEILD